MNRRRVQAVITEDRGPLGPNGQRVIRVRVGGDESEPIEYELSEYMFDRLLDEPSGGDAERTYVQAAGSDTWHWCRNCSTFPSQVARAHAGPGRPTSGELCNQCLAKERHGVCARPPADALIPPLS